MAKIIEVQPLRTVQSITVSEEQGPDLGNPHYFWMAHEYTMHLECGHVQVRVRDAYHGIEPEHLRPPLPKRVRCSECPSQKRVSRHKPKPAPEYDSIASALVSALLRLTPDAEDDLLVWVAEHGRWIEDDTRRSTVHGALAVHLHDVFTQSGSARHQEDQRAAIVAWSQSPTVENKKALRKITKRLYGTQHAPENKWYVARALVCLGSISAPRGRAAKALMEALTWDPESRDPFYANLWAARQELDALRSGIAANLAVGDDATHRELAAQAESAKEEMDRAWNEDYPEVGERHTGILMDLLHIFEEARGNSSA